MKNDGFQIDWNRFNGYSFQDMCNDLLVHENPAVVPLKSGPYRDAGMDAFRFRGKIGDISGDIVFQSKYRLPRPGKANFNALKAEIKGTKTNKGEISKAEDLKADHLIIMTNVSLTSGQITSLLGLAKGSPVHLHLWEERKIKSLLLKHPFVWFYYVKGPEHPMFVAPKVFFADRLEDKPEIIFTHQTLIRGRSPELRQCWQFLRSESMVLLVYASPGQGKSRLVLEFSKRAGRKTDWVPLFIRPEGKRLEDHLSELNPKLKYLLFLEDAHLDYRRLREFTELIKRGIEGPAVKLVLTARISFKGLIDEALASSGIQPTRIGSIRLPPLPKEQILNILKDQLPNISELRLRDLVPLVKDSPLLAITAARLINSGEPLNHMLKPGVLRKTLFELPLRDLKKYCQDEGKDIDKFMDLLTLLSALQPLSLRDDALISKMAAFTGTQEHITRSTIDQLVEFGFLKLYGTKVRLVPEIFGTIILESRCLTPQGNSTHLGEQIANEFYEHYPERILDNLAEVGQISFPLKGIDIIKSAGLFESIKARAIQADNFGKMRIMENLEVVAARRPREVLDIIEAVLTNPIAEDPHFSHAYVLGSVTDTLYAVALNPNHLGAALDMLKRLTLEGKVENAFMNKKPDEAIRKVLSYGINKPASYQNQALDEIMRWKDENLESYRLAIGSITPILQSTASYTSSSGAVITFGNVAISANKAVTKLRQKAVSFLIEALRSGTGSIQLAAIDTVGSIGKEGSGPSLPKGANRAMSALVEREILQAAKAIKEIVLDRMTEFYLLGRSERRLWDWWASETDKVSKACIQAIRLIQQTPEYVLFKVLYIENCPAEIDIKTAGSLRTLQERRNRFFSEQREEREEGPAFFRSIITKIGNLGSYEYWSRLLKDFDAGAAGRGRSWKYGGWLFSFSEFMPTLAYELFKSRQGTPWEKYGRSLLAGIKQADHEMWLSHLDSTLENAPSYDEDSICDTIDTASTNVFLDKEIAILRTFSAHPSERVRAAIADNLSRVSRFSWQIAEELTANMIKHSCSQKTLDEICCGLIHNRPPEYRDKPTATEEAVLARFQDLEEFERHWSLDFIGRFARTTPDVILELIEKRAKAEKGIYELKNVFSEQLVSMWKAQPGFPQIFARIASWTKGGTRLSMLADDILPAFYDTQTLNGIVQSIETNNPDSIIDAADIISAFPKEAEFFDAFAKLFSMAEPHGSQTFKRITGILSTSLWVGGGSRSIGSPSPADISAKQQTQRILDRKDISSRVRSAFHSLMEQIEGRIQSDREHDAEFME